MGPVLRTLYAMPVLPCEEALRWAGSLPAEMTPREAWERCPWAEWLMWLAGLLRVSRPKLITAGHALASLAVARTTHGRDVLQRVLDDVAAGATDSASLVAAIDAAWPLPPPGRGPGSPSEEAFTATLELIYVAAPPDDHRLVVASTASALACCASLAVGCNNTGHADIVRAAIPWSEIEPLLPEPWRAAS